MDDDYDELTGWPVVETITDLKATADEVREAVEMANPAEMREAERRLTEMLGRAVLERAAVERRRDALVDEFPALKSVGPAPRG